MSGAPKSSIYGALDAANEIRLLEFLPSADGEISLTFHTASLSSNPQFTALSYVWGDKNVTQDIKVDGATVPVTRNLFSALHYVKQHWENEFPQRSPQSFRIWVDAICINQSNIPEKNLQVQRMCSIFGSAELVLGWLGPEDQRVSLALETMRELEAEFNDLKVTDFLLRGLTDVKWMKKYPKLTAIDPACSHPTRNWVWAAMDFFCTIDYWSRAWIFQEVVIASRFLYISSSVSATSQVVHRVGGSLSKLCLYLHKYYERRPDFIPLEIWSFLIPKVNQRQLLYLLASVSLCQSYYRVRDTMGLGRSSSDGAIAAAIGGLRATVPKDHVYAILAISTIDLIPDYGPEKSVADVFIEYIASLLEKSPSGSLSFLSQAGTALFNNELMLPSWTPNFVELSRGAKPYKFPGDPTKNRFSPKDPKPRVSGRTLTVWGTTVQTIRKISDFSSPQFPLDDNVVSFLEGFRSRHRTYVTGVPVLEAMYRTLTLSISSKVNSYEFMRALVFHRQLVGGHDESDTNEYFRKLGLGSDDTDVQSFIMQNFFSRAIISSDEIKEVIAQTGINEGGPKFNQELRKAPKQLTEQLKNLNGLRLIETEDGYLGLVPEKALKGDMLCLIKGWRCLAILRRYQGHFLLVGPAFVTGLMNGEPAEMLESGKLLVESFDIQ